MLQWCTEPDSLFAEFRRVLAPGGMLMFTTFGPDTLQELRSSWARVDECTHVNAFADMHDLGDLLVRAGLAEPVMDAERLTVTYGDLHQLMRDLKHMGAHNVTAGRPRGLTGRGRLQRLVDAYEGYRREDGLPASYEVVYGHAWSPQVEGGRSPATVSVELRALRGRTP
jgi:malonyl-CoA O-methyltransferase